MRRLLTYLILSLLLITSVAATPAVLQAGHPATVNVDGYLIGATYIGGSNASAVITIDNGTKTIPEGSGASFGNGFLDVNVTNISVVNSKHEVTLSFAAHGGCTETDAGYDLYDRGTATGVLPGNSRGSRTDTCSDAQHIIEYSCTHVNSSMGPLYVENQTVSCPGGCSSGACQQGGPVAFHIAIASNASTNDVTLATTLAAAYQQQDPSFGGTGIVIEMSQIGSNGYDHVPVVLISNGQATIVHDQGTDVSAIATAVTAAGMSPPHYAFTPVFDYVAPINIANAVPGTTCWGPAEQNLSAPQPVIGTVSASTSSPFALYTDTCSGTVSVLAIRCNAGLATSGTGSCASGQVCSSGACIADPNPPAPTPPAPTNGCQGPTCSLPGVMTAGSPDPQATVAVFGDLGSPYYRRYMTTTYPALIAHYAASGTRVAYRWVWFPLSVYGSGDAEAARVMACAARSSQGTAWLEHAALMSLFNSTDAGSVSVADVDRVASTVPGGSTAVSCARNGNGEAMIAEHRSLANGLGVKGVPTFEITGPMNSTASFEGSAPLSTFVLTIDELTGIDSGPIVVQTHASAAPAQPTSKPRSTTNTANAYRCTAADDTSLTCPDGAVVAVCTCTNGVMNCLNASARPCASHEGTGSEPNGGSAKNGSNASCTDGCMTSGECYAVGTRLSKNGMRFCRSTHVFVPVIPGGAACTHGYECASNTCSSGVCAAVPSEPHRSLIAAILSFFLHLIGIGGHNG